MLTLVLLKKGIVRFLLLLTQLGCLRHFNHLESNFLHYLCFILHRGLTCTVTQLQYNKINHKLRYSCVTQDNSISGKVQSAPLLSSKPFLANHFSPLHTIVVHVCMFDFLNPLIVQKKCVTFVTHAIKIHLECRY